MKNILLLLLFNSTICLAQLNMNQLGYVDVPDIHSTICNDIWGYTDENGNEYALVGTEDGVSVVNVTSPATATEIAWIPGLNSVWRDIKVSGDFAYVTTEADEGLRIIDLSPLPASSTFSTGLYSGPSGNPWLSAHNIYEDNGFVYIFGAGRGNGGVIILDVVTDPMNPIEVGTFDNWYAHDGFVVNDTGYFAHINDGFFSIVDLTDKANPILLGTSSTPSTFTHNIWTTSNGDFAFTTDEVSGGYIGSYDVSDPTNIKFLDKIQSSPGNNIMPHNSHVLGDYLVTSYYADGVVIHDIARPNNLIEVANFDTSPLDQPGSVGCWGAYPFFSSGNILATDRQEGLFILGKTLHPGAYLEGNITEFGSGIPLNNVEVTIDGQNIQDFSNVLGDYGTGIESTGAYDVTYFKVLYFPQTISQNLTEGLVTIQDVALQKIPQFNVTVTVLDAQTLNPIENVEVSLNHTYVSHQGLTDVNGEAIIGLYYQDNYDLIAGKWGYVTECFVDTLIDNANTGITIYLDQGIYDDFSLDFGWTVYGDAAKGHWVRDVPLGVEMNGLIENPFSDTDQDCGDKAFVTGNSSSASNTDEVGQGQTVLLSPIFDLSGYSSPHVNFKAFYFNKFGAPNPDDTLFVDIYNGTETINLAKIHIGNTLLSQWLSYSIEIPASFTLTSNMQLVVSISDYDATLNIAEAAFDYFSITDFSLLNATENNSDLLLYPNPFSDVIRITGVSKGQINVYDLTGRRVRQVSISEEMNFSDLKPGVYLFEIRDSEGSVLSVIKQIKE